MFSFWTHTQSIALGAQAMAGKKHFDRGEPSFNKKGIFRNNSGWGVKLAMASKLSLHDP
jgi:hypothetical protein